MTVKTIIGNGEDTLMINRCLICKYPMPETSEDAICERLSCQNSLQAKSDLVARIKQYKDFWDGKPKTEDNYKAYLIESNEEKNYQAFLNQKPGLMVPRRIWHYLNVIDCHQD